MRPNAGAGWPSRLHISRTDVVCCCQGVALSPANWLLAHAGFEDYAKPIIDAIDPQREFIAHALYRDSTLVTEHYQCVKDMNRLNRPLEVGGL